MSETPETTPVRPQGRGWGWLTLTAVVITGLMILALSLPRSAPARQEEAGKAPELEGGVDWLNTSAPLKLKDLRGKIVVLDFWTLCCINCIHILPDLAKIEKKYPNEVVVIGVHTAKFPNEKKTESIRKAILRYEIAHPVVNDADMKIWRTYLGENGSWPSLCIIDPEGRLVYRDSGEGQYDALDATITKLIKIHTEKKTLNTRPMKFDLARGAEPATSPLYFPGKVVADPASGRLFIADSTHHRIVITTLAGKQLAVAGTGEVGHTDGKFTEATFNDPQGLAIRGETLYVADRKNHLVRALDLKGQTVKTIAGIGQQGRDREADGEPLKIGLNSPWDLWLDGDRLFIAMAGHHQIWRLDLAKNNLAVYAGLGDERLRDGLLSNSAFAQPSGLTSDGKTLYVADSETSSIRAVPIAGKGSVHTLVGEGLFEFGDIDGVGPKVRLQHALGVTYHDGKLYIADTYNSKLKVLDPTTRSCTAFPLVDADGKSAGFAHPGGINYADGKLYVADTNNHRIRVVDLKTKAVSTLKLEGVEAPKAK
jgi:DNA-binding beta-propeller fold protein YncE